MERNLFTNFDPKNYQVHKIHSSSFLDELEMMRINKIQQQRRRQIVNPVVNTPIGLVSSEEGNIHSDEEEMSEDD